MSHAYISDAVLDGTGKPVVAATVILLRANDFPQPPAADPGSTYYTATTVSEAGGVFVFDHLVPDDYHVMVQYGGQTVFRYFVAALPVDVAEVRETRGRALVPRTLSRLLAGENVTIYAVGDGLTAGYNATGTVSGSWVSRLATLIGQQLTPQAEVLRFDPGSFGTLSDGAITGFSGPVTIQSPSGGSDQTVQVVNCAVKDDTVQRVLRRADANLLAPAFAPVDLFLLQLGVGDSWSLDSERFVDPDSFARGLRSLVEVIRTRYFQAEIGLLTPPCSNQPDAGNGGSIVAGAYTLEQYAMSIRRVALDLGIALIDLRQLFADRANPSDPSFSQNDGYGSWLSTAGGNHVFPSDAGHQAIADEVFKLFGAPGAAAQRPMRIQPGGPAAWHKNLETCRLAATHPALQYAGGHWSTYLPSTLADLYFTTGGLQRSHTAGDSVTFKDAMVDFAILTRRGGDCGQIAVSVDGGPPQTFDLYRGLPSGIADTTADGAVFPMEVLWVARGLSDAVHTITITVLGTHDPAAADSYVYLDGAHYTRAAYTSRRVETMSDANARIQYGVFSVSVVSAQAGLTTVSFNSAFRNGSSPVVLAVTSDNNWTCSVQNLSLTSADIHVQHRDGTNATATIGGTWFAIG